MTPRDQLIVDHLPQVGLLAKRIYCQLPKSIDFEDVHSAGTVGLIKAADRFDGRVKFWSYAQHRVRSEILDYLRGLDHLSRNERRKVRATGVEGEAGLAPLSLSMEMEKGGLVDIVVDARPLPDSLAEDSERRHLLQAAIRRLPKREREVIKGRYFCGDTCADIGRRFGVNESRVSQIKGAAIESLAAQFQSSGLTLARI